MEIQNRSSQQNNLCAESIIEPHLAKNHQPTTQVAAIIPSSIELCIYGNTVIIPFPLEIEWPRDQPLCTIIVLSRKLPIYIAGWSCLVLSDWLYPEVEKDLFDKQFSFKNSQTILATSTRSNNYGDDLT